MRLIAANLLLASLLLAAPTGPVPCEVAARTDPAPAVGPAPQADPTPPPLAIGGPLAVPRDRAVRLTAQGVPAGSGLLWEVEPRDDPRAFVDWVSAADAERLVFVAPPGRYRVELLAFSIEGGKPRLRRVRAVVAVEGAVAPKVDPKVDPVEPGPAPAPVTGLRVIFVVETGGKAHPATSDRAVREYLDRKCAKGATGRPEWRVFDPQQAFADSETATVRALWEKSKPLLGAPPQVIVASDQSAEVLPLTGTPAEVLALLKKYGGE